MNNAKIYQAPEGIDMIHDGVAYGKLTELEYDPKTTGGKRKCYVYTPPNYDSAVVYPVLYLLSAGDGAYTQWPEYGAPNEIISNLIASGETKPMIVVMPNVETAHIDNPLPEIPGPENITPEIVAEHFAACDNFINDLRDDLMPFIKERYSVSAQREQCAIAGASIGGREALFIGIKMPEVFSYIGGFSPSPGLLFNMQPPDDWPHYMMPLYKGQLTAEEMTSFPEAYKDKTFILMYYGKEEEIGFIPIITAYQKAFDGNGIKCEYYIAEGGHDYHTWKNGLYHFIKQIF